MKIVQTTLAVLMIVLATIAFKNFQNATEQINVIAAAKLCLMAVGIYLTPAMAIGYGLIKSVFGQ